MRTMDHIEVVLEEYFVKYGVPLLDVQFQVLHSFEEHHQPVLVIDFMTLFL